MKKKQNQKTVKSHFYFNLSKRDDKEKSFYLNIARKQNV